MPTPIQMKTSTHVLGKNTNLFRLLVKESIYCVPTIKEAVKENYDQPEILKQEISKNVDYV